MEKFSGKTEKPAGQVVRSSVKQWWADRILPIDNRRPIKQSVLVSPDERRQRMGMKDAQHRIVSECPIKKS